MLLTGNALLFLTAARAARCGEMYSANFRPMMEDSKLYSVLTGLALVVVLLSSALRSPYGKNTEAQPGGACMKKRTDWTWPLLFIESGGEVTPPLSAYKEGRHEDTDAGMAEYAAYDHAPFHDPALVLFLGLTVSAAALCVY